MDAQDSPRNVDVASYMGAHDNVGPTLVTWTLSSGFRPDGSDMDVIEWVQKVDT
jgi:hypothetical protein